MTEHHIDDLVRVIEPENFKGSPHGAGHRIVATRDKTRIYEPTLLGRLFGGAGEKHYFVKTWTVPMEVKNWAFHWSEGTSAIHLDFASRFVIQANEDLQALKLVEVLQGKPPGQVPPGQALYELVNACLHREIERLVKGCNDKTSLLDMFQRTVTGMGESEELNRRVGEEVSKALGGLPFRIGFQLQNAPPMQIEVRQADDFSLADSKTRRKAETTALLHLDNYQAFKKSGLETEAEVRQTIGKAITQAVKQLLFAGKYYDVVRSFTQGEDAIEAKMRLRIQKEAASIGYRVEMFQTYPDIAALKLLDPLRIDIPPGDDKYYLVNSTGYVQVGVALSASVQNDFSRLHLLIDPDEENVVDPIVKQVKRICRDTIQRFDRMQFNLDFEAAVVPAIKEAIVNGLQSYGVLAQVIHVVQSPTEDATRYMAVRGRTIGFRVVIDAQGNAGDADEVTMSGKIEVIGIADKGWERFEAKDFGYRQDTLLTESRLRAEAGLRELTVSDSKPLSMVERRMLAVDLELHEIRERVESALREALSKEQDLATHWRTLKNSQGIIGWAQRLAEDVVSHEFGLSVALRGVQRENTETEETQKARRRARHALVNQQAAWDVEHQMSLRRQLDNDRLKLLEEQGSKEVNALDDEDHPMHEEVSQRVARLSQAADKAPRLDSADALKVLPKRQSESSDPSTPWSERETMRRDDGAPPAGRRLLD